MSKINPIHNLLQSTQKQGLLHSEVLSFEPPQVLNTGFYPSGQIKFSITIVSGRIHGISRFWHENDQLSSEISYTQGRYDGRRCEWYANGQMKSECFYRMNVLHGLWTQWHANGMMKEKSRYVDGREHGIGREYNEKGEIIGTQLYINGIRHNGKIEKLIHSGLINTQHLRKLRSPALRRILLEEIGFERLLRELNYEVIEERDEHALLKIHWHKEEPPVYLVKVKCPSTGIFYTLRVPPHVKTIHQAIAWTFGLSEAEYQPQEES